MAVKKIRPITPGQRFRLANDFSGLSKEKPVKSLTKGKTKRGGRAKDGKMTVRSIGGGHKQRHRQIDFKRDKDGVPGKVKEIQYDPNRSARIALLFYADGEKRYIIAPSALEVGAEVLSGDKIAPEVGNCMTMRHIPVGTIVHNIELTPGKGAQMARSAGAYAQILAHEGKYTTLKLPSGEMRLVLNRCRATVGTVGNIDHMNITLGKAGRKRWMGRRSHTRGVVMNPVDHPMGGGEGKASGGHPRNRNGLYAKGKKTRNPNKYSNRLIIGKKR